MKKCTILALCILILTLNAQEKKTKPTFEYGNKHAVSIHPLFPFGLVFRYAIGEIDYLYSFKEDLRLLVRPRGELASLQSLIFFGEIGDVMGSHLVIEIETGIRKLFILGQTKNVQFAPYVQISSSHGYQEYEKKYIAGYDSSEVIYDPVITHSGYSGNILGNVGLHLQAGNFLLTIDAGFGVRFNPVQSEEYFHFKPNFTAGVAF